MSDRIEQLKEYARIIKDTPYALKTYLTTYDNTQHKNVPLELFSDQEKLIYDYENYNENITKKYRQAGVSTVTAAWISKIIQTCPIESPHKVLIVANKKDTAVELSTKIRNFLLQWPDWINVGLDPDKKAPSWFRLNNKCEVKAVATSKDSLRSYTPTILIFDEAAYIEAGEDFWAACMASLSTGGKVIVISTPNGIDQIYYPIYSQAITGLNDFKVTDLRWYYDPRYTKDLVWVKTDDILHFLLNREEYNEDEFIHEKNRDKFDELFEKGYKPCSSWFELMSKKLKWDRRKIAQELEAVFNGSGDNVVPSDVLEKIKKTTIKKPIEKYMANLVWQWKKPIDGHRYIIGCLPPNEKVLTNNGLKPILDITNDEKLINENGDYVNIINKQIYNVENEEIFNVKIDNTYRSTIFTKEHPILASKPILKRNYKKNHDIYAFNERYWDFDFDYVKVKDLEIGDWIKTPNIYNKKINVDLNKLWFDNVQQTRYDFVLDNPLYDDDFWWLIGLWLGDGWLENLNYSKQICFSFNKKEKFYLDKCITIINKLFNRNPIIKEKESVYEICFNSVQLHFFIEKLFGKYSYGKKIPEKVKFLDKNKKINLLKGYFDSDGSWMKTKENNKTNSKISFVSINLELLESIQDILFSLGIVSSLNKLRNENDKKIIINKVCNCKKTYNLCLANNDSLDLIELFDDDIDIKLNKFDKSIFKKINKRVISSCHLSKNKKWIYFRVKDIIKDTYTGNVYNFECDTHTFMCHHITTHNCDVSRGDSEDFSSINIIDFDEREQVLEYVGKMAPDDLASLAYKWGKLYSAFCVIDITGGMGVATSRKMIELDYKDLYVEGINTKDVWAYDKKMLEKIPGLSFNNKRTQIVAALEEQIRHGFIIRSERLVTELNTFVYLNGRPDHMKGCHDDSIMAIAMAMYVGEICFSQLERNENKNKAMLEAWSLSDRSYDVNQSFYSHGTALDAVGGLAMDKENELIYHQNNPMEVPKDAYKEYSWLFGNIKR